MDVIKEVDLREALMEIAQNNTHTHLHHDLHISFHQMERAAKLMGDDPEENTLIWVSYPFGIDCYTERDVFQEGTRSYNGVLYHAEMTRDRQLAYAVEITEEKGGRIGGNLYELDIKEYGAAVRAQALPSDLVRVYTGEDYGGEFVGKAASGVYRAEPVVTHQPPLRQPQGVLHRPDIGGLGQAAGRQRP